MIGVRKEDMKITLDTKVLYADNQINLVTWTNLPVNKKNKKTMINVYAK